MRARRISIRLRTHEHLDFAENLVRHFFLEIVTPGQAFAADFRAAFFPDRRHISISITTLRCIQRAVRALSTPEAQ
jgi:hypothetical protein